MEQVLEFFNRLLSTTDWPARWHCGIWTEFHGWLYITSDIIVWFTYFLIPVAIFWFVQKQPKLPFLPIFSYFAAFIILCGLTHLIDAIIFWWPAYRLSALLRFFTAIISMVTVFKLVQELPNILQINLKNNEDETQKRIQELEKDLQSSTNKIADMREEIKRLKSK